MSTHQDVSEYQLMRSELLNIKGCITNYMGYVLGGTGAALFGMAAINKSSNDYFLAYAPAGLSVILLLVLLILFYKFTSHNRGAGFCKTLSHEKCNSQGVAGELISWERCIQALRESDRDKSRLIDEVDRLKLVGVNKTVLTQALANVVGKNTLVDNRKFIRGWRLVIGSLVRSRKDSSSWNFPVFVSNIFFAITTLLMVISGFNFIDLVFYEERDIHEMVIHSGAFVIFVIFTFMMWSRLASKLYTLMYGSATVNGYYIRFLPIRAQFLEDYDIECSFFFSEVEVKKNFIDFE